MSTKIVIQAEPLVHGDTTATNLGLVLKNLPAGEVFSVTKTVDRALAAAALSVVTVFYRKTAVTTVNLKFSVTHIDTGTVPSTPTIVTDAGYTAKTLAGSTGQINSFTIPTTLTSFSSVDEGDFMGLAIIRQSTDTGDFEIVRIEFEFNKDAGESATSQAYDVTTLAVVKDFLAIPTASTTYDDFLQRWLSYLSLEMEGINGINNKIRSQTLTNEIGDGNGRTKFRPSFYPIVAIGIVGATDEQKLASVQYDNDGTWTDIETDLDNILIHNPNLWHLSEQDSYNLELTEGTFPEGTQNIRLTYQAGWSTIPGDLLRVCLEKVADFYKQSMRGDGRFGLSSFSKSEGVGSKNTQYIDFTERHQKMMKPYRRKL